MNDASTSRREANKARTRAALVAAVYDLIDTDGCDDLTAERVADAAGLSRRTFFNYFESVEAVLALGVDGVLERVGDALAARPADEPLLDSALTVIDDLFTIEFLTDATRAWRAVDAHPAARRHALAAQADHVTEFAHRWSTTRLDPDGADPLRAAVLTASFLAAFDEGRQHWLARHDGPVDDAARTDFLTCIHRAVGVLRPAFAR